MECEIGALNRLYTVRVVDYFAGFESRRFSVWDVEDSIFTCASISMILNIPESFKSRKLALTRSSPQPPPNATHFSHKSTSLALHLCGVLLG